MKFPRRVYNLTGRRITRVWKKKNLYLAEEKNRREQLDVIWTQFSLLARKFNLNFIRNFVGLATSAAGDILKVYERRR